MALSTSSELKRGWRILVAASLGVACGAAQIPLNSLGAIVPAIQAEFGWGRGDIQWAFLYFTLAGALTFPLGGILMDRYGARPVALVATLLFGISWATIAFTPHNLFSFYLLWALMGVVSAGSTPVSWTRSVNGWFEERRGLALAITLTVSAIFGVVVLVALNPIIQNYGWRMVFIITALLPLFLALPIALLWFHEPPAEIAQQTGSGRGKDVPGLTIKQAFANYRLWVLLLAIVFVSLSAIGIIANVRALLKDDGYSAETAGYVAATIALSVALGRMVTGWLIDKFWAPAVVFPMLLMPALACVIFALDSIPIPLAFIAAALIGLAAGAESDVMAYLTVRYFGMRHYGVLFGLKFAVFAIAAGFAPGLFGSVYDHFNSYDHALYGAAILFIIAAFLMLTLGKYPASFEDGKLNKEEGKPVDKALSQ
jgi:MFS transporter, OFA family, oxalate/formate antiporter